MILKFKGAFLFESYRDLVDVKHCSFNVLIIFLASALSSCNAEIASKVSVSDVAGNPDTEAFLEISEQPVLDGLIHLPGLLATEHDTLILIAQSRIRRGDYDPSDVVVLRSDDHGKSWSEPVALFSSEESGETGYSCMLVEDRTTSPNTILAFYTIAPSPWKPETLVWWGRKSNDEGVSWSSPFRVKHDEDPQSKPSNGGHGFQFGNGRLVIPGRGNFLYSDDGGLSWTTKGEAKTVETKVAPISLAGSNELDSIYIISRRTLEYGIYGDYGEELGESGEHGNAFTTLGRNPGLTRYETPDPNDDDLLLMSGILGKEDRTFGVTYSVDQGRSWSGRAVVDSSAWYSDMDVLSDGTIVVAYTVDFSDNLKIARFNLSWLTENVR